MARVTVEDCLRHVGNRFDLVIMAAKRARQLTAGSESVLPRENDKNTVLALREIGSGLLDLEKLMQEEEKLLIQEPEEEELLMVPEETMAMARSLISDDDDDDDDEDDDADKDEDELGEEESADDLDDELDLMTVMDVFGNDDVLDEETRALMAEEIHIPGVDEERFSGFDAAEMGGEEEDF